MTPELLCFMYMGEEGKEGERTVWIILVTVI